MAEIAPPRRRWAARIAAFLSVELTVLAAGCPARSTAHEEAGVGRAAPVDRASVFFVGHSLVNFEMPAMVQAVAASLGAEMSWDAQLKSGGSLQVNWEAHAQAEGSDARIALPTGRYDTLVLTEAVSLDDMIRWMEPARYGGLFYDLAVRSRPDVRVFFYTTWHERTEVRRVFGLPRPGDFRAFIDEDRPKWEGIVDGIARGRRGPPIRIVPGGEALARVWDEAREGSVPGIPDERPLFKDDIHLSALGNYFIALVQFATIFGRSPIAATASVRDEGGELLVEVPPATARALQRIAWETVTSYPRTGVTPRNGSPRRRLRSQ